MQLVYSCSRCQSTVRATVNSETTTLTCGHCGEKRAVRASSIGPDGPATCVLCGCDDLWRQKDFPPQVGLTLVGVGALASSIAWGLYWPKTAIGILMGFALVDLLLYAVMKDVLVCYRCGARHRDTRPPVSHPRFSLELAERYRQETKRLEESQRRSP